MGEYVREKKLYLTVSKGKLVNKKADKSLDGWEGVLTGMHRYQDDYEGKVSWRWELTMQDLDGQIAIIQMTDQTWFAVGFFARITQVEIQMPFMLGVMQSDKNEKISFCWMRQNDQPVAKIDNFPRPKPLVVNGKPVLVQGQPVMDWDEVDAIVAQIADELYGKGVKNTTRDHTRSNNTSPQRDAAPAPEQAPPAPAVAQPSTTAKGRDVFTGRKAPAAQPAAPAPNPQGGNNTQYDDDLPF